MSFVIYPYFIVRDWTIPNPHAVSTVVQTDIGPLFSRFN